MGMFTHNGGCHPTAWLWHTASRCSAIKLPGILRASRVYAVLARPGNVCLCAAADGGHTRYAVVLCNGAHAVVFQRELVCVACGPSDASAATVVPDIQLQVWLNVVGWSTLPHTWFDLMGDGCDRSSWLDLQSGKNSSEFATAVTHWLSTPCFSTDVSGLSLVKCMARVTLVSLVIGLLQLRLWVSSKAYVVHRFARLFVWDVTA